jgi:TonB-linked SusC/RagA family outer membrane protein
MKLRVVLGILLWLIAIKQGYAQERFSFTFQNVPLKKALERIERKSACKFLYNNKTIANHKEVNLQVKDLTLPELLGKLLSDSLSFKILRNNLVVIVPVDTKTRLLQYTGTVTDSAGVPLTGTTLAIQGMNKVLLTDKNGEFTLDATPGAVLTINHLGHYKKELLIGKDTKLNIVLKKEISVLNEVVITALDIRKEARSIGYAVQDIKVAGSHMVRTHNPNVLAALAGKSAGLGVQQAHFMFDDPQIFLRGKRPLIVVDGVPNNSGSWNLNMDDIESITILKGPVAAALYGQQGANGAIQITGKRGVGNGTRKFTVEVNTTTELQTSFIAIPEAQHEYGPGEYFKYAFKDGRGAGTYDYDYYVWGPRYEGQPITQWNSQVDVNGNLQPLPWISQNNNNMKDFLRKGVLSTTNVAVSSKTDQGDYRVSLTQLYQRGIVPNTQLGITNVNLSGGVKMGSRARLDANISYNKQYTPNYPSINYGPESPIYELLIWNGSNFNINDPSLRNYWYPGKEGTQQRWVEYQHYNNPWFNAYEYLKAYYKDVLTGYTSLSYKFNDKFDAQFKTAINTFYINQQHSYPVSGLYYGRDFYKVGGYSESYDQYYQNNTAVMLNMQQSIGDKIGIKASIGSSLETIQTKGMSANTSGGLVVPGIYTLQNSINPITSAATNKTSARVLSAYGYVDIHYKHLLYLNMTGRMDRNSNMPERYSTYFYPQASLSAILSDIIKFPRPVSFVKLKAAVTRVAEGLGPYALTEVYSKGTTWEGHPSLQYAANNTLYDKNVKPAYNTSYEGGVELGFFNNLVGLKTQLYKTFDGPQIFPLPISEASGYASFQTNGLVIERRGLELELNAHALQSTNFKWNMLVNWSSNIGYLKKVYNERSSYARIGKGERYDQLYIHAFERNPQTGAILYYQDGTPVVDSQHLAFYGYTNPNWTMGTTQMFSYKNWSLALEFDGSVGGKVFNFVNYKMWQSGTHEASANEFRYQDWLNRDNPGYKGSRIGVGDVVISGQVLRDQAGNIISDDRKFAPNTTPVLEQTWANSYGASDEINYQSKTYFKLRGITLTWQLPEKFINGSKMLSGGSVSFVARNVLYFAHTRQIDLDRWTYTGQSDLEEPSVRSIGVNVNLKF